MNKVIATLVGSCLFCFPLIQLKSQSEESTEKFKPRIALSYFQANDGQAYLKSKVSHREGKKIVFGENVELKFYINEVADSLILGTGSTDENGTYEFQLEQLNQMIDDTIAQYKLIAVLEGSSQYLDKERSLEVAKARLEIELRPEDSVKYVDANLTQYSGGDWIPVADAEVKFFVQRTFSLLPIGGAYTYTDASGNVSIEFPTDLPGDENGAAEIVVQVVDHELFGTLEKRTNSDWGITMIQSNSLEKRTLWSSNRNAPISLVVISCTIILGIWGVLFYLIILLNRIKKLGKSNTN